MIPPVLRSIADRIGRASRVEVTGDWETDEQGRWHLPVRVRLSTTPTDQMPAGTKWRLVIGSKQPTDGVHFYPDADGGLEVTFRHQDQNAAPNLGEPWRQGKPCLERPIGGLGRDNWADEPREIEAAAIWKTGRLLQWIDAAANDDLVAIGAANELPAGLGQGSSLTVGFAEVSDDMDWAITVDTRWGFASVPAVPGAKSTWVLTELFNERAASIRQFNWGSAVRETPSAINSIWLLAHALPVREPWDAPTTWAELTELLARQGIDLTSVLASAGARHRASSRPAAPHRLLIGFPYSSRLGHKPERLHWLAIGKIPLAGRTEKRNGFRPREESRRMWDRELSRSNKVLSWVRTENWAPDQLRSRGGAEQQVRGKTILIVGAGSLGSAVAENLCRAGALNLGILDGETLTVGNLVRHALTMVDVGLNKADALARTLNFVSPSAEIRSMPFRFQADMPEPVAETLRSYDVIIDCTGSDELLDDLAAFDWRDEKLFVSLSMTWGAGGLLAFSASETIFPVIDAKHRFAEAGAPLVRHEDANVEAIGCWHPVYPADADDVQQWAALGTKFVRETILDPKRRLKYFRRTGDGGTEVINV